MIDVRPISGFVNHLPEEQLVESKFRKILEETYSLSGFTPLDTSIIERNEVLLAKWADDNEIYGVHRIHGEPGEQTGFWLRFDLTVPLARYVAQHEGNLSFPFRRQHIARVYRGERPQKGRYREFYQADVDIIGNGSLPLFADVEVIYTLYSAMQNLNIWGFKIHINNKKLLSGFLLNLDISENEIGNIIAVIDKKDKMPREKLAVLFENNQLSTEQIDSIFEYIDIAEQKTSQEILGIYSNQSGELLKEGLNELQEVYSWLLSLWVKEENITINPAISRGLNYYTGTVFESFLAGAEWMWSFSSGGRYENLASAFTKNSFPGVWWSIGLSRIIAMLQELGRFPLEAQTPTKVLVLNMWDDTLEYNLWLVKKLRENNISSEIYLDKNAKFAKQIKYADKKGINYVVICGTQERENNKVQFKKLISGEQLEITFDEVIDILKN